ncbi:MAG: hypothetical protein ACOX4B_06005 [Bacillota bacterium]
MTRLPLVFSGLAVLFGALMLFKFKENRIFSLLFYLSLCASGVSRMLVHRAQGLPVRFVDVGVTIVFGVASIGEVLLLRREREERAGQS